MTQPSTRPVRFVVFASPKSGTTWIQKLIGAHKDMHCGESRLFGNYFNPANPTGPHITVEQTAMHLSGHLGLDRVDDRVRNGLTFDMIDAIAKRCAHETGASVYGEKFTPYPGTAEHAADMLAEYNPNVRIVHLVRDGRDVIVSGAAHRLNIARQRWASGKPGAAGDDLEAAQQLDDRVIPDVWFQHFLDNWIDVNTAMLEAVPMFGPVLRVQYEELLSDPDEQVLKLLRHIAEGSGVGVTPGQAKACVEAASFRNLTGGREPGEEDRQSFFRKGAAGDWKNWFTIDQMHEFDERAGELLEALGYDRGIAEQAA